MKVLVLGGNGFIGKNLCKGLAGKGYDVFSFDIMTPQDKASGIHYIEGDFFDVPLLERVIKDKDVIYHAVSTINPTSSSTNYMRGYEKDFIQTVKLCSLIAGTNTKLIFLSSGGTVYGEQKEQPIKENALPRPINHYGNVKLCIENTMLSFCIQNNADMLIARISNPYGPYQDYTKGVGFIDAAIKQAIKGRKIEIWGEGENIRDYVYIDDVVGMLATLIDYNGEERIFNVGSGEGRSIKEVLDIIKNKCPDLECVYMPARSIDVHKIILDCSKIKNIYKEKILQLEEGLDKYYRILLENSFN